MVCPQVSNAAFVIHTSLDYITVVVGRGGGGGGGGIIRLPEFSQLKGKCLYKTTQSCISYSYYVHSLLATLSGLCTEEYVNVLTRKDLAWSAMTDDHHQTLKPP